VQADEETQKNPGGHGGGELKEEFIQGGHSTVL
jgi:hypothetical protein